MQRWSPSGNLVSGQAIRFSEATVNAASAWQLPRTASLPADASRASAGSRMSNEPLGSILAFCAMRESGWHFAARCGYTVAKAACPSLVEGAALE